MNTKSVQVVMSTYNGEKYLKEQIDSILSQEGVDVRLYIRDDGSSDRTTDILASYQEHKNVKIEKGNNLGFAKSFLTALDECDEADYYAFSDQYTHQSIKPYHHLTLRSASGQGERPGGSPGSRMLRRSSTTR